jgi:5-(carboxyamino)imidazole ribonucleotide mutase
LEFNVASKVAVIMGSDSDYPVMREAVAVLRELEIEVDSRVVSAHRTPDEMAEFAREARENGFAVIVAGAGGAAHLPGMVAAYTTLPVIGVPIPIAPLSGLDALYSIVQMPRGVPVATVAIGGAHNAGLLAAQILASGSGAQADAVRARLDALKTHMREAVLSKKLAGD